MTATRPPGPELDWRDGQPWSARFGDVYHSRSGGLGQSRHVFLDGNDLPQRFARLAAREVFVVGETGFGTGLNFLAAWALFEQVAPADARLHFLGTELHPLAPDELAAAQALWPELAPQAAALQAQYGAMPPGWHRFALAGGRVTLTLLVGDAARTLPDCHARVDAWFLDGFSPSRNPELWNDAIFAAVSRLSRPGTTCATWTVAAPVRHGLVRAGFAVAKVAGFPPKREMLRGTCMAPLAASYLAPWSRPAPPRPEARTALVIGAGIAGAAAAASLASRGLEVTVLERHATAAAGASGNPQGMLYIKPSAHGTALTALSIAGLAFTRRELIRRLPADGLAWSACGVLALAHDAAEAARQARLAALGWPGRFMHAVDAASASTLAGMPLPAGGLFYPEAGWVHPPALCAALLSHPGIGTRFGHDIVALQPHGSGWRAVDAGGDAFTADIAVVATARDAMHLTPTAHLPLKPIRGQITQLPATADSARLATVLCGESYAAPARDGRHCVGATFGVGDAGDDERDGDHARNLDALETLAPALARALGMRTLDARSLSGRAAVRCVTPDYLPVAGACPDATAFASAYAALAHDATTRFDDDAPWLAGLYVSTGHGSRGLVSAPIAGELIAAVVTGEPLPLPAGVAGALGAARFLARARKRRNGSDGGSAGGDPR